MTEHDPAPPGYDRPYLAGEIRTELGRMLRDVAFGYVPGEPVAGDVLTDPGLRADGSGSAWLTCPHLGGRTVALHRSAKGRYSMHLACDRRDRRTGLPRPFVGRELRRFDPQLARLFLLEGRMYTTGPANRGWRAYYG